MPPTSPRDALTPDGDLYVPSTLSRTSYFFGQLLTQSDLTAEQRYHVMAQRLAQRETFGTGTVAGLRLEAAESERRGLLVRAGLAMDPDGRALLLDRDICVRAVEPASTPSQPNEPLDDSDASSIADGLTERWGVAIDGAEVDALAADLAELGLIDAPDDYAGLAVRLDDVAPVYDFELEPGETLRDHLYDALVGTTYVGIQYAERGTDLAPAVLDASCCGDGICFPSRTNEGVRIVLSAEPLPPVPDPFADALAAFRERAAELGEGDDFGCHAALCDYLLGAWRALPPQPGPCGPQDPPVVPLGRVLWDRFDAPTRILDVDNCTLRPLAPGVPPVRALHEVLSGCVVAAEVPPRVVAVTPLPGDELVPAPGDGPPTVTLVTDAALAIPPNGVSWELDRFGTDAVDRWSLADNPPSDFSVAASVGTDDQGRTRIVRVQLLPGQSFSLPPGVYRLRVNLDGQELRSEVHGLALDGNPCPVAVVPSGDGTPGGVFETTFYVAEENG